MRATTAGGRSGRERHRWSAGLGATGGLVLAACAARCSPAGDGETALDAGAATAADGGSSVDAGPLLPSDAGEHDARVSVDGAPDAGPRSDAGPADAGDSGGRADAAADAASPPYAPCPPAGTPCVILPLGDSITAGYQSSTGGGYRVRLLEDIWAANHDATFVGPGSGGPDTLDGKPFPKANAGYFGYTIDPAPAPINRSGISPLVPADLTTYAPHIVTLMIGTNDVDTNDDLANAPTRLAKLLDSITATSPSALLVVAQITPTGSDASNTLTQAYNAAIPGLVATRVAAGKHIVVVDMYAAFTKHAAYRTDYMADGLHPNDTGYAVLGDAWYAALAPHL